MTKIRQELIELLKAKHGPDAKAEEIIDTLYQSGALDVSRVRRAVVYEVFYDTLATSSQSTRSVEWDLAMQYDMSRSTVQYIVRRGVA